MSEAEESKRTVPTSPPSAGDTPAAEVPTLVRPGADLPADGRSIQQTVLVPGSLTAPTGFGAGLRPSLPPQLGPYRLLEELGHGGMGIVMRAIHEKLGTQCAVKVLIAGEHASPEAIARFQREAAGVAKLGKHPNIVSVFDLGAEGSLAYYAMELIRGQSLRAALANRTLSPKDAALLLEKVARALHFAHQQGLVHRDVKPNNIILREDGEPQVVDFGLARDMSSAAISVTGQVMGTPEYMAPEQATGLVGEADARADVYAVGAVLYEALVGIPPHRGGAWPELLARIQAGDIVPPRKLRADVPRDIETVCLKCLELNKERRYPSAEALADDLARFARGEPVQARPVSGFERLRRRVARRWTVVLPTSIAALLVVGVGAMLALSEMKRSGAVLSALELGRRYRSQGLAREARDAFERAHLLDSSNPEAADGVAWADEQVKRLDAEAQQAKARAEEAEALLAKAQLVSRVLGRWSRLYKPLREMESYYYSPLSEKEIRQQGERPWRLVDAFMSATPQDPTSQATMRAFAGWARRLAGYPDEAAEWMRQAQKIDPDVPYGALMQALLEFCHYTDQRPLPAMITGTSGVHPTPMPEEPLDLAARRREISQLIDRAATARVWGKEGAEGFRTAMAALQAMEAEDYARAEGLLSDALATPELAAFEPGLLMARGKVRYLRKELDAGIEDVGEVLKTRPRDGWAWMWLADLKSVRALEAMAREEDPRDGLREAIETYGRARECLPEAYSPFVNRASAYIAIGDWELDHEGDAAPWYDKALVDCEEGIRRAPDLLLAIVNHGCTLSRIGRVKWMRGEDPEDLWKRAGEDFDNAIRHDPAAPFSYFDRGNLRLFVGEAQAERDADPRADLDRAIADFQKVLALGNASPETGAGIGRALIERGKWEETHGADARKTFQQAIASLDQVLAARPDAWNALQARAVAYKRLAATQAAHEEDPTEALRRSRADCDANVARFPKSAQGYCNRGLLLLQIADQEYPRGKDPGETLRAAVADFREAVRLAPKLSAAHEGLGDALASLAKASRAKTPETEKQVREGVAELEEAVRLSPQTASAWYKAAKAYMALGSLVIGRGAECRDAEEHVVVALGRYLERVPADADARRERGMAHMSIAEMQREEGIDSREHMRYAIADLETVLVGKGRDAEGLSCLGEAYVNLAIAEVEQGGGEAREHQKKGIEALEESLRLDPSQTAALSTRALAWRLTAEDGDGDAARLRECYTKALADDQEVLKRAPDSNGAHDNLASDWLGLAEAEVAAAKDGSELYRKALAEDQAELARSPNDVQALFGEGFACEGLKDDARAVEAFQEVLRRQPGNETARAHLDLARKRIGLATQPEWVKRIAASDEAIKRGDYAAARKAIEEGLLAAGAGAEQDAERKRTLQGAHYNLACIYALLSAGKDSPKGAAVAVAPEEAAKRRDTAFAHLAKAIDLGLDDAAGITEDTDLAPLHDDARWKELLGRIGKK